MFQTLTYNWGYAMSFRLTRISPSQRELQAAHRPVTASLAITAPFCGLPCNPHLASFACLNQYLAMYHVARHLTTQMKLKKKKKKGLDYTSLLFVGNCRAMPHWP